ncbi:MAG: serine/threonine-protein kinase [Lentisphaeria bacterium]
MFQTNSMGYLEPGTILTGNYKYQIVSEVGRGAMAVVYLAKQIDLDRLVAVKVLSSELASNTSFVLRFFNEVRTAAALSHPNIIQAYDAGIASGDIYYFAMEYVNGETLLRRLLREGHLEVAPALKYALEIANALNYGWQGQRLTHGDIKPENIMINDLDQAKLADFGLAKVTGHDYEGQELMLTPHYASPELINGMRPKDDCRADIYAFGASLYHLLAGRPPFPGNDGQAVMKRHLHEAVEPLFLRCPGIRSDLSDFIGSLLEKKPENRPLDWTAVLNGLERCNSTVVSKAGRDHNKVRFRHTSGNVKISQVSAPASAFSGNPLKPKDRKTKSASSYWWYVALLFSTALLLIFSYLYWCRHLKKCLDVKLEEVIQESKNGNVSSPDNPSAQLMDKLQKGKQQALPASRLINQADPLSENVLAKDVVEEKEVLSGLETILDDKEPDVSGADEKASQAEEAGVFTEENSDPAFLKLAETTAAQTVPVYPDYSLFSLLSALQRQALGELQAWYLLATFQHIPGQSGSAEKMMRSLEFWLQQNPEQNSLSELVEFVQKEVVPRLDEGPSRLLLKKEVLLGKTFTARNNLKLVIRNVLPEGLEIDQVLEKGTMLRTMTWREVMDAQLLLDLYRVVFFEAKIDAKPESYLAQLLFSRNAKVFQTAVKEFTAAGGRQGALWEELGNKVILSDRDYQILKELFELSRICRQGSRLEAGRIARRLLRTNNTVASGYRELLEVISSACEEFQLDILGGSLVREAQELLPKKPDQALALLNKAQCFCNQVKYPEKEQLSSLQESAIRFLADQPVYIVNADGISGWPFVSRRNKAPWPFWSLALASNFKKAEAMSEPSLKALQVLANLEAGNWSEVFGKEDLLHEAALPSDAPAAAIAALLYGRSLLQWRNGEEQKPWQTELLRLHKLPLQEDIAPIVKSLLFEYTVLSRCLLNPEAVQILRLYPDQFWLSGKAENWGRTIRIVLTGLLVQGQYSRAFELNEHFLTWLKGKKGQKEFCKELQWLQSVAQPALMEKQSLLGVDLKPSPVDFYRGAEPLESEYQFRLLLAALGPFSLSGREDRRLLDYFTSQAKGWQRMGGDAIFDWLLRRVSYQISLGEIKEAYQLCGQIISLQAPCLFAYLPRIHLLRAALLCLNGQTAALYDVSFLLRNCAAASEQEKTLIKIVDNQIQFNRSDKEELRSYWGNLLWFCFQLGGSQAVGGTSPDRWVSKESVAGEMLLQKALLSDFMKESEPKSAEKEP